MLADVAFEERSGIPIARVRGEVDMSNAPELGATLQAAIQHGSAGLVLDFTETDYLDSAGLHFIFDLGKRLRDRGQRLELVVPDGSPVQTVLEIVNVNTLADVWTDLGQAIGKLQLHAADVPAEEETAPPGGGAVSDLP
jgi:anti-anti-sigma factor